AARCAGGGNRRLVRAACGDALDRAAVAAGERGARRIADWLEPPARADDDHRVRSVAAGLLLVWLRAAWVAAPVLAAPATTEFSAIVERVEPLPAKGKIRILALPQRRSDLPPRVRLTLRGEQAPDLAEGEAIGVRARLMPPPVASLPGGYDFAQRAWFDGIGAVGTVLGEV